MKRLLIVAGLLVGVVAVAALGYGILRNNNPGLADKIAAKAEAAAAPFVAAVDVTYNAKGEPIAARPVVLTADNQIVGYAEPHPLSQIGAAHTFVKGVPAEENFLGGVSTSRLLVGQFTCFDRGGIRMVRLDSKADGFRKDLIFVANDDCCTSMAFANDLKAASTDQPQYVGFGGYRMVCVERGGGFGGRGFVNYNLPSIESKITWVNHTPWNKRSFVDGDGPTAVLTQAVLVGWNAGCTGSTGSGGGWQVQCGVGWSGK